MQLIRFLLREETSGLRTLLVMLVLMAAPLGLVGYVIGSTIDGLTGDPAGIDQVLMFGVLAAVNVWMNGLVVTRIIGHVERLSIRLRTRILDRVRALELVDFERIGRSDIFFCVASSTRRISDATVLLGRAVINLFGTAACLILIAVLSWQALAVILIAFVSVGVAYAVNQIEIARSGEAQRRQEFGYFHGVEGLVRGFKEIKLHKARDDAFFAAEIVAGGAALEAARGRAGARLFMNYFLYTLLLLLSVGASLYLLPLLFPDVTGVAVQAAVIAGLIPVSVLRDLPMVARAAGAVNQLSDLERRLDAAVAPGGPAVSPPAEPVVAEPPAAAEGFRGLAIERVSFQYTDRHGDPTFTVGPVSFQVAAGSICFIVGGNGSGKSTVLKLLTGLYPPYAGRILVNGEPVSHGAQRPLFSALFAEPHVFQRLYGYRHTPPERVTAWLRRLDLDRRVAFGGERFSDLKLSTGQRKRVALAALLIEDRPVLALDEWAADQDPEYRQWFYRELLPALKAEGRTVIAITHDDRFFNVADQVIRMEAGAMLEPLPPTCPPAGTSAIDPA